MSRWAFRRRRGRARKGLSHGHGGGISAHWLGLPEISRSHIEPSNKRVHAEFGPKTGSGWRNKPNGTINTDWPEPSQSMGMLVTRGERRRSGATGRPAPVCQDVAKSNGAD